MDDKQYYEYVSRCLEDLMKNAAHSFGIDFLILNEASVETEKRPREL